MLAVGVLSLGSKEISSRHVSEAELLLDEFTLGAFAGSWSSKDKNNLGFFMFGQFLRELHFIMRRLFEGSGSIF